MSGETRYPLAPLLTLLERQEHGATVTLATAAERLGVARSTVYRWTTEGIPDAAADSAALAVGYHPCLVWGEAWWEEVGTADAAGIGEERLEAIAEAVFWLDRALMRMSGTDYGSDGALRRGAIDRLEWAFGWLCRDEHGDVELKPLHPLLRATAQAIAS